ncbi:MAG: RNA polymerase sigma factor [Gammaproteobacteria bacterium]
MADNELMARYRDRDLSAFNALYQRHRSRLYRFLLGQLGNPQVSEDCFQEVWGRIIRARSRYESRAQFSTYLFTVAHNIVIDHYRWRHRQPIQEPGDWEQMSAEQKGPDAHFESQQKGAALKAALAELPADQREVFLLHEQAGLTLNEIAGVMGTGRETIKSRLRYAVRKLRRALDQEGESSDD